jgi:hypothetical protein
LHGPEAGRRGNLAMRLEPGVEFHVFDDDPFATFHRLGAGRALLNPHQTEMIEKILVKAALGDDFQASGLGVIELDVPEVGLDRADGVLQHIIEGGDQIGGRQQPRAERVEPGRGFQLGGHSLFTLAQRLGHHGAGPVHP